MNRRFVVVPGIVAVLLAGAATALAAPVSTFPPKINGDVSFLKTVSCDPGSWSGSPTSFSYAWFLGGGPIQGRTDRTFAVDQPYFMGGYTLACQVTATDAASASASASSAAVQPALGRTKLTIAKVVAKAGGVVVFTGKLTPGIVSKSYGDGEIVLHRNAPAFGPKAVFQLGGPVMLSRKGTFKIVGHDKAGKRKIRVDYYPGHQGYGLWAPASATRTVTVKK